MTSLRTKMQVFALVLVLVPSALFALLVLARVRATLERAVGRQLEEIAHDALEQVGAAVADARQNVRAWARQDVMRDVAGGDADERIARFLASLRRGGSGFRELLCIDRSGRVVAASDARALGAALGDREWARRALAGEESIGPVTRVSGEGAVLEIAVPVRDPERPAAIIGALLGRYDWRRLAATVGHLRRTLVPHGLGVDVLLLDAHGTAVGESWRDELDGDGRERLRHAAASVAGRLPASTRGWVADASAGVLVGYDRARGRELLHGWQALVIEPESEAFAPIRSAERHLAVMLAALLVGVLAVAAALANRMSRPLRELTRATRELACAGGPSRPIDARSRDEIGQLAAAFNAMTAELETAQQRLLVAAKFAFAGELAAGVAHEVRTPLGILRSSAQMLGRSPSGAERLELMQMIVEEVDRLDRVIDGLIEIARPHQPAMEPTDLGTVLGRALDFVDGQAREKGVTIHRALETGGDLAYCDAEEIYGVGLHLVMNALQALPPGGEIAVRTLPRRNGRVGFEVADNGPGIPVDARPHIFTPFFTLRNGGSGLGLALVQQIVQAHQGIVTVESDVGRGTTFRVELPGAERT